MLTWLEVGECRHDFENENMVGYVRWINPQYTGTGCSGVYLFVVYIQILLRGVYTFLCGAGRATNDQHQRGHSLNDFPVKPEKVEYKEKKTKYLNDIYLNPENTIIIIRMFS